MRQLYTLLFTLALPLVLLRLYWRGRKAPQYRQRWSERLGLYPQPAAKDVIWLHAVSVGEAEAAFPLIRHWQQQYPHHTLLVTTTTPTGSARVKAVLADSVLHVYLPYDLPWIVARFLSHFRPLLAVFMEKELWPNLFAACGQRQIPLYVINARLSARSASAYQKIPALVKPTLAHITRIAAQTADDAKHFVAIGAAPEQVAVLGNLKFDLTVDAALIAAGRALKQQQFAQRFVWMIASTHQGEEELVLQHYPALKAQIPELLLMIAPRHPERFQTVQLSCEKQGLIVVKRSERSPVDAACDVYLADSMGELKMLYAAADVAFVGGSLVGVGGHNVLEPAAVGVPVLFGPHMFNFQQIAEQMLAMQAAQQCGDAEAVAEALLNLYQTPATAGQLVANAQRFLAANQGAMQRISALLAQGLAGGN